MFHTHGRNVFFDGSEGRRRRWAVLGISVPEEIRQFQVRAGLPEGTVRLGGKGPGDLLHAAFEVLDRSEGIHMGERPLRNQADSNDDIWNWSGREQIHDRFAPSQSQYEMHSALLGKPILQ